nr:uncharacterized protein LOC131796810 [Pocillopora verrucosa]
MNTFLLVLFFGASVALAESPFGLSALDELSDEGSEEIIGEFADVENDPHNPFPKKIMCLIALKKCKAIFEKCRPKPTLPELARDEFSDENDPHYIPSGPPKPVN